MFLQEAETNLFASFLQPMAGYLHLLPRAIAFLGVYLDPAMQPGWYLAACLMITAVVGNTCLSERNPMACRYLLPLVIAVIPHTGEVPLNPTNLQWITALGLLVTAVKDDPCTIMQWVSDVFFVVIVGLTGPFILFVVPLLVFRSIARRTLRSHVLLGLGIMVSLAQIWFLYSTLARSEGPQTVDALKVFAVVSKRLFACTLLGPASAGMNEHAAILAGAAMLAYLMVSIHRMRSGRTVYFLLLATMMAIVLASGFTKRFDVWDLMDTQNGDRYFFIPKVVMVWIMIGIIARGSQPWVYLPSMALISTGLLLNIGNFRFAPYRNDGWYEACKDIRQFKEVSVTINPDWTFNYTRRAPIMFPRHSWPAQRQ